MVTTGLSNCQFVQILRTDHQYCDLPKDTLDAFLNAPSMGPYYRVNIDGAGESEPYDCRTHKVSSDQ
ncbi:hypothetical protein CQ10_14485 [Bradyrhizobium valentinum]|uniref:Uncharacterized protein n=1 Tax=Bradyrhizobium valentinum TaxID=1518501 RepID=A0A0R3LK67_9BRAD|nr:hypothetical protein CP49_40625 [Bradyrhizobium valentinum]KRR08135.1 hypothetical protein CQ10_14485 [Bradyrhizobium valentinum]